MAVHPKKKGEEDKLFAAIAKCEEADPTLAMRKEAGTKETILAGIGEMQLKILEEKLESKYHVGLTLAKPRIAYRETIKKATKAEGKYKKQSGGHGQYGHVLLEITPQKAGEGNEFTETIFGGSVPRQFIPAVEKGTQETLANGILAGYPVVDVKVNLYDGSYHPVDSSEASFKSATAIALKKGVLDASPVLLEPIDTPQQQARPHPRHGDGRQRPDGRPRRSPRGRALPVCDRPPLPDAGPRHVRARIPAL